jgi:nitrogenase molybdenum-iron protein NifN
MANTMEIKNEKPFVATRNACKLCAPLGASVAFKGIAGCVPLIHGSQGCATYIRRYLISHYKEPVDIASSNFSAETTIFGGESNLSEAIANLYKQYNPSVVGIASTCLSETIGDHVERYAKSYLEKNPNHVVVSAKTPSYCGSHIDGFHQAVTAILEQFAVKTEANGKIALFPGFLSPADYRHIKEILDDMGIEAILVPDLSETLDNPHWNEYQNIPQGGTSIDQIRATGGTHGFIQFGEIMNEGLSAGRVRHGMNTSTPAKVMTEKFGISGATIPIPIGIKATDLFFEKLDELTGINRPAKYALERGRLIDGYVDGHKYVFGKKALVYGEEDFALSICSFLSEIGIIPSIVGSGGNSGRLKDFLKDLFPENYTSITVLNDADFEWMAELSRQNKPDIVIGHSKGYSIARELNIPIVRVGFPIHDRVGGQRLLHIGYRGTHRLFDEIANALIEYKQNNSPVGYKYM